MAFLTSIWQQFQRILNPLNPSKHFLWMEPFYSKMFFDNNTINYKNITSTLGEFWTHFIGKKALKVYFFEKMVNLTHSYLIPTIFIKTGFFIFQDWYKNKRKTKLILEMIKKTTLQKIWTLYLHYMIRLNPMSKP